MAELKEEHFEVIDRNKSVSYETNTKKLIKARTIYNQTNGLQNISEDELKNLMS